MSDSVGTQTTPQTAPPTTSTAPSASTPVVVLIHGAWHDQSTWDHVVPLLATTPVATRALTLPSTAPGPELPGLDHDVAAVVALLDTIDRPVILCGHSYGGMVISAAGHHRNVKHLVYLAAFAPDHGETVLDLAVGEPPPLTATALKFNDNATMTIDPALAAEVFYGDVDSAEAAERVAALHPSTASTFTTPAGPPAWKTVPSTYVICEADRAISVDREEQMAARATPNIVRWPTSHSPFLSQPHLVADLLATIATSYS
jgi:pimeloyl-ACP methyl ester carboxylesterase